MTELRESVLTRGQPHDDDLSAIRRVFRLSLAHRKQITRVELTSVEEFRLEGLSAQYAEAKVTRVFVSQVKDFFATPTEKCSGARQWGIALACTML